MAGLDTSSLVPYAPPKASPSSAGLDLSGLEPMDAAPLAPMGERAPQIGDVAKQAGYGLLSGIPNAVSGIADTLEGGMANNLSFSNPTTGENTFHQLGRDLGLIKDPAPTPAPYVPKAGSLIKQGLNAVGLNPDNLPQPRSGPERVARMAGEGLSLAVAPELALGRGAEAASIGNLVRSAVTGATSGGAAQAATEVVPDQYKPLAALAGGLAGGVGAELGAAGVAKTGEQIGKFAAPFTQAGREATVGQKLVDAADDPVAATKSAAEPDEIVPGSSPTTFQQTGDMGLGSLERSVATQNPGAFMQRRADQNAARLDALSDVQAQGHPEAVSDFFRNQLSDIDNSTQASLDTATEAARQAASQVGGTQAPDVLGNQLRDSLQSTLDASRAREAALWKAVDPDGALNVVTSPLKRAATSIYDDASPEQALTMTPLEKQFAGVIGDYGPTLPFSRLTQLRSSISAAMRDAKSPLQPNDIAYGRLSQLRQAVEDAISDSVQGKVAQEQQAVASGALAPEETVLSRWAKEAQAFVDSRRTAAKAGGDNAAPAGGGAGVVPPQDRAPSKGVVQPAGIAGNSDGAEPLIDQATADRLAQATAATKERKQTFGAKPVASILQREGASYPYKLEPENVLAQVWKAGPAGAASVTSVLKAAKSSPDALDAIRNGAAASLRRAAQREDGTIDPTKFAAWRNAHGEALKTLEQASPGASSPFETAAKAADHLATVAQQRKDAITSYEKSAAGKLIGVSDPADVTKTIGGLLGRKNSAALMHELAGQARKDPAAFEGLRRSIVQFLEDKLVSNTEAATSGKNLIKSDQFQTFVNANRPALRQVFSEEEIGRWEAIAKDLNRANRSVTAVKLPGQSNTAQDLAGMAKHGERPTLLHLAAHFLGKAAATAAPVAGYLLEGPTGLASGLAASYAGHLISSFRAAGIVKMDDLLTEAMLDPQLAKALMMKAPKSPTTGAVVTLRRALRTLAIGLPTSSVISQSP